MKTFTLFFLIIASPATWAQDSSPSPGLPPEYKLVYEQNFAKPDSLDDFIFTDRKAWRHGTEKEEDGRGYIEHTRKSAYTYAVRSPFNIGLVKSVKLRNFVLDVDLNDMKTPLMEAADKTFDWGWIGFGSFDDTGKVSRVRIYSPDAKTEVLAADVFAEGQKSQNRRK